MIACSAAPSADLEQSAQALLWMAAPRQLRRSSFSVLFPDGTPTQYVSYAFSDMGRAEWPEFAARVAEDPELREMTRAIRMPLLADGVAVTHTSPKLELGRQVVLRADPAHARLIVEGYASPTAPPLVRLERAFEVPELRPRERAILEPITRANLDTGASAQAF